MRAASDVTVDAYNDHCFGRHLPSLRTLLPQRSSRRHLRRRLSRSLVAVIALGVLCSVVVAREPLAVASASSRRVHVPSPKPYAHRTRINGRILRPAICSPGGPSLPSPSADSLAYLAEASTNEVQVVDEATGALIGSPITVGTSPKGVAYWQPPVGSTRDPLVIVTNSGSHSVTVIDAVTQAVVATISLPSGSGAIAVAADPSEPYAVVVDHQSGKVSIIDLTSYTDAGEITLTSTSNALSGVVFESSGTYAYITDPTDNKIFSIAYTAGPAPYYTLQGNYHNASYKFTGIASDLSGTSSDLYVTDAQSSSGHLLQFTPGATLSAPTISRYWPSDVPGAVSVAPGGTYVYVDLTDTNQVSVVDIPASSATRITPSSSFTHLSTIALSSDGATLLSADTASSSVEGNDASSGTALYGVAGDSETWGIATPPSSQDAWDAYVTGSWGVDVVNSTTDSLVQDVGISGAGVLAASPDGKYVYAVDSSGIAVIQTSLVATSSNPVVATITGLQGAETHTPVINQLAVSPNGDTLVATDSANGAAYVIDLNSADGSTYYRKVVGRIGLLGSGIGSTVVTPTGGLTFSPDGLYAYATVQGTSSNTYDGVTVLSLASATTTGYSYDASDAALTQDSTTMISPTGIAADPNGEYVYVTGTNSTDSPKWDLYKFPVQTSGQLANGSSSVAPVPTGTQNYGVVYSPESDSAYVSEVGSQALTSVSQAYDQTSWSTAIDGLGGNIAVTPDGQLVATTLRVSTCGGIDGIQFMNAGSGTVAGTLNLSSSSAPVDVAIAPQSSPQAIATTELAGGASNPAEAGVTSGMNDVVSAGTPSDAPGASAGVDTATGAYSLSLDSMTIPDVGPSLDQSATYDSSRAAVNDLLGYGWDYAYGITATQNTTTCVITVTFADGATTIFNPATTSGTCVSRDYQATGWAQDALTTQASCNGTDSCWVVTLNAMTSYSIDETTGELVKVEDLNGNAVTITWGSHTACSGATSTEPCQVTAADGIRTLTFSYPAAGTATCPSGSYTCVVVTDPLGRTLTYVKNGSGQLVRVSLANGTETATYVLGYNSSNQLTSWWDPQNEAANAGNTSFAMDVTYNTAGKVTQVTGPEIASVAPLSTTAVTPTTTVAYEDFDSTTGNGTVLVENPDFNQSNYEPGASQTLDTYADFQLVSSVTGYGPLATYDNGSTPPVVAINPSESAYPLRDDLNLMPSESMNALAGTTESAIGCSGSTCASGGSQLPQYDSGVTMTTYDALGNALTTTDPSGNTTSTTYNALNEPLVSTDAMGNQTTNTYGTTGELLTTTSPPTNAGGSDPETSSYYNSNGTLCASRDADQVAAYGVLSSCVSAGSNATTYSYDSSGDTTLATTTDSATQTSTTQSEYDANGDVCATLSPDGYAITGDRLSSCPSSGSPYAEVTVSTDVYEHPTEAISSLAVAGTATYATSHTCTDANGNTTASVGPMGSFSSCSSLSPTTSIDASFTTYNASGDKVQAIGPLAVSGTQGPTSTSQFDANGTDELDLSSQGYVVWAANHSASMTPYETGTLVDDQGNTVATAPEADTTSSCVVNASAPCPDESLTISDQEGQQVRTVSPGSTGGSATPVASSMINNPDSTAGGTLAYVGTGAQETTDTDYNANATPTYTITEHWTGSAWVTDSTSSTAYAPDGTACWRSPTSVTSPSCTSPPSTATVDYYDANGNVVAEVGLGGSATIKPGGTCDPTAALDAYSINGSRLCAFTTYNVYDEAGKLIERIDPSASSNPSGYAPAGSTTLYSYDPSGNSVILTNSSGNTVTSTYDGANRIIGVVYSDASATNCSAGGLSQDTCYVYNDDGSRSEFTDSTGTTTYTYNSAGQPAAVTDSSGNTITYGYNAFAQRNCLSYPGFASADSCVNNPNNGANTIDSGEVWYAYDSRGRLATLIDWNGDAFTYGYDCAGNVAWLAETPSSQIPSVTPCEGSGGTPPVTPVPTASGTTFVVTAYSYSSGSSGGLLTSNETDAVTNSGSTSLLEFGSLAYDDNNNLTTLTPKVSGVTEAADAYNYDTQHRVTSGPETSGSADTYSYVNSTGTLPFYSSSSVDQMGIDAMPSPGSSAQLGSEYAGNGELCWIAVITSSHTGSCSTPGSTSSSYETATYNNSGDLTAIAPTGYGTNLSVSWNVDSSEPICINVNGSSCSGPSSSQPQAEGYTYNADGLRASEQVWDSSSHSVATIPMVWDPYTSGLLSNGAFDFLYANSSNVPIAQLDPGDGITTEYLSGPGTSVRGLTEVSPAASTPYSIVNYTDYDAYGTPITAASGVANPGGLTQLGQVGDPDSAASFGFGGGYIDPSGMIYLVHRYYDPALTSFLSVDPKVASTGLPYAYADDNPVTGADPLGLLRVGGNEDYEMAIGGEFDIGGYIDNLVNQAQEYIDPQITAADDFTGGLGVCVPVAEASYCFDPKELTPSAIQNAGGSPTNAAIGAYTLTVQGIICNIYASERPDDMFRGDQHVVAGVLSEAQRMPGGLNEGRNFFWVGRYANSRVLSQVGRGWLSNCSIFECHADKPHLFWYSTIRWEDSDGGVWKIRLANFGEQDRATDYLNSDLFDVAADHSSFISAFGDSAY